MRKPTLIVFLGGEGNGAAESIVATARWAASLDTIESALESRAFSGALLITDGRPPPPDIGGVEVDAEAGAFHFGRRLSSVLQRHAVQSAVYIGGGSLPLLRTEQFAAISEALGGGHAVTNNAYSSDLAAFPVTEEVMRAIEPLARDNALARALAEAGGLMVEAMPRSVESQMDIDSPSDLAVLTLTGMGGCRLQAYLQSLELDVKRYRRVLPLFLDPSAQIVVAGRVGSHAWQYLERETACRVRLFAEERGMEAEGRAEAGLARSLLGFYLESVGVERFFRSLSELGDASFIDTRVLLAHMRIAATRDDRFLSDLGRWRELPDGFLRDFTRGAAGAPMPVLLGGHSLMSGGLMLLNEDAWQERDAGRL